MQGDEVSGPAHRALLQAQLGPALQLRPLVSANAHLGADAIATALRAGAQIVVYGREADPSLTMAGHLLECGTQVTGGDCADPGLKDGHGLATLGYPIAEINADGHRVITKPTGTGGRVDVHTVTDQLLYELHDPAACLTPDGVADISAAIVTQLAPDRVQLAGVQGHARPATLKANVCFEAGWLAEGEISDAGARAEGRARLAAQVLRERLADLGLSPGQLRADLIGVASVFGDDAGRRLANTPDSGAPDVRLRLAPARYGPPRRRAPDPRGDRALHLRPGRWGGVRTAVRPTLGTLPCLLPRTAVPARFDWLD